MNPILVPENFPPSIKSKLLPEYRPGLSSYYSISQSSLIELSGILGISLRDGMELCLDADIWPLRLKENRGVLSCEAQKKLLQSQVAVIGCGGLGGTVIMLLARLGIGKLTVCDGDHFEESNLNRQQLCHEGNIGKNKALAAQGELALLASYMSVNCFPVMADSKNIKEILEGCNIVIDCLDSFKSRLIVEETAHRLEIPFIHGAIAGWDGFVMLSEASGTSLKQFYGEAYIDSITLKHNCHSVKEYLAFSAEQKLGVPATTPALVGCLQVMQALKSLGILAESFSKISEEKLRKLWHVDLSAPLLEYFLSDQG